MQEMSDHTTRSNQGEKRKRLLTIESVICVCVFAFFLGIYTKTLCPTVFWWDSGELIANIAVLGIPHRPGFPIYVLLGRFFSLLPIGGLAVKVNFLSALFASFSLVIFYKIFRETLTLFFPAAAKKRDSALVSAVCFLLVFAFTYSFWIQATRAEVYSLTTLFFALLLFLSLRYLKTRHPGHMYFFFFLFGLGLGNHHLSLLSTAPALFFLLLFLSNRNEGVIHNSSWVTALRRFPLYFSFFLLGLSVYLYLPIRSFSNPVLAWGDTQSVSGSVSSVFALESLRELDFGFLYNIGDKIVGMIHLFYGQLTLACFLISLLGMLLLSKRAKKTLIFFLLLIMANCASVIFMTTEFIPTNPHLHGYLLPSLLSLAFLYALGGLLIIDRIRSRFPVIRQWSLVIFVLISFIPLYKHVTYADLSSNRIAYDYGYNIIRPLDSNSVLFVDNVNLSFVLRELQYAEQVRPDVKVIERGLLGFHWYAAQKRKELRGHFLPIPDHLFGEALFYATLKKSVDKNIPTYMEFTEGDSHLVNHLIPSGYVFKVSKRSVGRIPEGILSTQKEWEEDIFSRLDNHDFTIDCDAQRVFALSLYRLGLFYEKKGMFSSALEKFQQVREIDPYNEELLAKIEEITETQKVSGIANSNSAFSPHLRILR